MKNKAIKSRRSKIITPTIRDPNRMRMLVLLVEPPMEGPAFPNGGLLPFESSPKKKKIHSIIIVKTKNVILFYTDFIYSYIKG